METHHSCKVPFAPYFTNLNLKVPSCVAKSFGIMARKRNLFCLKFIMFCVSASFFALMPFTTMQAKVDYVNLMVTLSL